MARLFDPESGTWNEMGEGYQPPTHTPIMVYGSNPNDEGRNGLFDAFGWLPGNQYNITPDALTEMLKNYSSPSGQIGIHTGSTRGDQPGDTVTGYNWNKDLGTLSQLETRTTADQASHGTWMDSLGNAVAQYINPLGKYVPTAAQVAFGAMGGPAASAFVGAANAYGNNASRDETFDVSALGPAAIGGASAYAASALGGKAFDGLTGAGAPTGTEGIDLSSLPNMGDTVAEQAAEGATNAATGTSPIADVIANPGAYGTPIPASGGGELAPGGIQYQTMADYSKVQPTEWNTAPTAGGMPTNDVGASMPQAAIDNAGSNLTGGEPMGDYSWLQNMEGPDSYANAFGTPGMGDALPDPSILDMAKGYGSDALNLAKKNPLMTAGMIMNLINSKNKAGMTGDLNAAQQQAHQADVNAATKNYTDYLNVLNPPEDVKASRYNALLSDVNTQASLAKKRTADAMAARGVRGRGTSAPSGDLAEATRKSASDAYNKIYGTYNVPGGPLTLPASPVNYSPSTGNVLTSDMTSTANYLLPLMMMMNKYNA